MNFKASTENMGKSGINCYEKQTSCVYFSDWEHFYSDENAVFDSFVVYSCKSRLERAFRAESSIDVKNIG